MRTKTFSLLFLLGASLALVAADAEYSYVISGEPKEPVGVSAASDPTPVVLARRTSDDVASTTDTEARGRTWLEELLSKAFRSTEPTGVFFFLR